MSQVGWSSPAGCTGTPWDEDHPCAVCGRDAWHCRCPPCGICGEIGNPDCYDGEGHGREAEPDVLAAVEAREREASPHRGAPAPPEETHMDIGTLIVWLDALQRAYGPDVPCWLEYPDGEDVTCAPLADAHCQHGPDGHRAVILTTTRPSRARVVEEFGEAE